MSNPVHIRVFDKGKEATDRFTIIINAEVYRMGINANEPYGYNTPLGAIAEIPALLEALEKGGNKEIGNEIPLLDLPLVIRLAIGKKINHNEVL